MKNLILLSVILLLFFGCKKDHNTLVTSVNGFVKVAGNSSPVAGATVRLLETNANCYTCGGTTLMTATSDGNGAFAFNFTAKKDYSYSVSVIKNMYYSTGTTGADIQLSVGKTNNVSVLITAFAWIKIHIKNVNPFDGNDLVGVLAGAMGSAAKFYGTSVDTIAIFPGYGNINNHIKWTVVKNNIYTNYDSLYHFTALDTTLYSINY